MVMFIWIFVAFKPWENGNNIGQRRKNMIQYFADHPEFAADIEPQVCQQLELGAEVSAHSITAVEVEEEDTA